MRKQRLRFQRRIPAATACLALVVTIAAPAAALTVDDLEQAYWKAVGTLATGGREAAVEALLAAEIQYAGESNEQDLRMMAQRQVRVARRLAADSTENLVPLALLHEQAYVEHLAAERLQLAIRSRETSVELLELYLVRAQRPDANRVVADLLTSIGGFLQENSMVSLALSLYQRALELAPNNEAALMGFAGAFERQGQYEKAVPYLRRLLEADPGHREARLRLGVNLLRLARPEEGRRMLEGIVAAATEDWILSLAYQELSRLAVAVGDPARSRALLEQARRRLPDDPSLPMQIAFLKDRFGGTQDPSHLAEALRARVASGHASPRALYARVGGESLVAVREAARRHADSRLGSLAESLGRLGTARGAAL